MPRLHSVRRWPGAYPFAAAQQESAAIPGGDGAGGRGFDRAGRDPDGGRRPRGGAGGARGFGPCRCLVLCGPGNNGGDGRVAARLLARTGLAGAASPRLGRSRGFRPEEAARADLVIDAVFGAGFRGTLPDAVADVLQAARRVLAVDVPSGLDGGTGQPRGRVRQADLTVTFARLKPGHLLLPGRTLCGTVRAGRYRPAGGGAGRARARRPGGTGRRCGHLRPPRRGGPQIHARPRHGAGRRRHDRGGPAGRVGRAPGRGRAGDASPPWAAPTSIAPASPG